MLSDAALGISDLGLVVWVALVGEGLVGSDLLRDRLTLRQRDCGADKPAFRGRDARSVVSLSWRRPWDRSALLWGTG